MPPSLNVRLLGILREGTTAIEATSEGERARKAQDNAKDSFLKHSLGVDKGMTVQIGVQAQASGTQKRLSQGIIWRSISDRGCVETSDCPFDPAK